jgi:hypothetical protein
MKKIIIALLISVLSLPFLVSCSDFLDKEPDDMLTLPMIFDNKKKVNEWLAGVYSNVQDPLFDDMSRIGCLSDDFQPSFELVQYGWGHILSAMQGSWGPSTGMHNYWGDFYQRIRSAYIFLDNVQPLPSQGLSEKDVEYMKLEARYLIVYYYMIMLQTYGPVPLITYQFSSTASSDELMLPRTPLDEIATWMDQELLELANAMPERLINESADFGRPTKGACLALRARLWTWMASPLFNGNPYYADVNNPDGASLFPQAYDSRKWQKAVEANKAVIDLAEKGIYKLYTVYYNGTNTIDPFISCKDLFLTTGEINKEIIWARPRVNIDDTERYFNPRSNGAYGSMSITQNLVDEFRMKDGKDRLEAGSGYREDGFIDQDFFFDNTTWDFSDGGRTPGLLAPKGTFNMWINREPRFYTTMRFHKAYTIGLDGPAEYANGQKDGRPSHDTPVCGYHGRKGTDPNAKPRENNYGVYRPGLIFRLAEFYLNYAEALAETDPGNPDILTYLNRIRERGGLPNLPTSLSGNADELKKHIRKEYRIEFAMEGRFRYDYLRRWNIAVETFKQPIHGLNQNGYDNENIGADDCFYTRKSIMNRIFDSKMNLWPIRQEYIDKNPNLKQNKGW